jgi:hypothetical protein
MKRNLSAFIAWLYGPAGLGAFSVYMISFIVYPELFCALG